MTVAWGDTAERDRQRILQRAYEIARNLPDPQIYIAAFRRDAELEAEAAMLDGIATFRRGPVPGTFFYVTHDRRLVLHYRRENGVVTVLRVLPVRSAWYGDEDKA